MKPGRALDIGLWVVVFWVALVVYLLIGGAV